MPQMSLPGRVIIHSWWGGGGEHRTLSIILNGIPAASQTTVCVFVIRDQLAPLQGVIFRWQIVK